ncbi:hypothetical protein [Sporosarcina sp. FSL W7-1283]|uniref:hypothetical protein n=1 Tax=Sporosarcina sp. FSL W7-1283 TaxID=2921560 RepID=UPI0030FB46FC
MSQVKYDREMFIFGEPVYVDGIGNFRFLTYKEYLTEIQSLLAIKMNTLHVYYLYRNQLDENDTQAMSELEELKKMKLFEIVTTQKMLLDEYVKILSIVLDENSKRNTWSDSLKESVNKDIEEARENAYVKDMEFTEPTTDEYNYLLLMKALGLIFNDEELFEEVRKLVMDMQVLVEEEVSEDKVVQSFIEKSRRVQQKNSQPQSTSDLASSIVVGSNYKYEELAKMTILQIYSTYYRIAAMKSYDTSTLFATVSGDVQIDQWNRSIDLFEKQSVGIAASEFNKSFGRLFK